jgi:hypothetical protein
VNLEPVQDLTPIGKRITWTNISRADISNTGLNYSVQYTKGNVDLVGQIVDEAIAFGSTPLASTTPKVRRRLR